MSDWFTSITQDNFDSEVLSSDVPVVVHFWAEWAGPCKQLNPKLREWKEKSAIALKIGRVNVDDEPDLCERFEVSGLPAVHLYKNGEMVYQFVGYNLAKLSELFETHL